MRMKRAFFIVLFVLMFGTVWCEEKSIYTYTFMFSNNGGGAINILEDSSLNIYTVKVLESEQNLSGEMRITFFTDKQEALKFAFECKKTVDSDKSIVKEIDKKIKADSNIVSFENYSTYQNGMIHEVYWMSKEMAQAFASKSGQ